MDKVDVTIIGGGVVGLAVAAELSQSYPDNVITLIEKNRRWGQETSSRNSEVIHAGLYYPASSLKTILCLEGNPMLYEYCARTRVPYRRTGKLVVAMTNEEEEDLADLYNHARQVGAQVELLDQKRFQEFEPDIPARAALYSPNTGIIDSEALMRSLYTKAVQQGVIMLMNTPVQAAECINGDYQLTTPWEVITSRVVINCAGLSSDQIANVLWKNKEQTPYQLYYCKGEYYTLRRRWPLRHLVYPMPGQHSLGVHITMDMEGNLRLGPNAYYVGQIAYDVDERYADEFYRQALDLLPGLQREDLQPGYAGIRPKLQGPDQPFHDFVITDEAASSNPGWINLVGIESPGLTSCLAIARYVTCLAAPYL